MRRDSRNQSTHTSTQQTALPSAAGTHVPSLTNSQDSTTPAVERWSASVPTDWHGMQPSTHIANPQPSSTGAAVTGAAPVTATRNASCSRPCKLRVLCCTRSTD